ncbi:DUF4272 domain-containing protein [Sphingosinicella terrae]|uniref:DUF4272 domain-containing protein n=1 Tax=Sphingosinicella terrae TaxID=2172047 RepID=UPI000E0DCD41|nr:DUF4272 domain-containing protein [Sphingosinicella terrae]
METNAFRSKSRARLAKAGVDIPATLPMIDDFSVRPKAEILDRIACLNAVAAVAHAFDKNKALAWISHEGILESLTDDELSFLDSGAGNVDEFKVQVEGMWALAWLVGVVPNFDFWRGCDQRFVTMLPDLRTAESSSNFRARANVRNEVEIGSEVDLAYCLHWALRDADIKGENPPKGITPFVVVERRRALEWAVGNAAWNEVSLDT